MRIKQGTILIGSFLLAVLLSSCGNNESTSKESLPSADHTAQPPSIDTETELLLKDLKENGDYVNSREFPSLIKASIVFESLSGNIHLIDIRSSEAFSKGHIKGAVNKSFNDLTDYFESGIKPFEFERIILISEDGQEASYTTSLLRLMGYGNVYAMRWGMSAWNTSSAWNGWLAGTSSTFQDKIETSTNKKPMASSMPVLNTGGSSGEEIAELRFKRLFEEDMDEHIVSAEEVFADPEAFYIINYDRKDKYENGHMPGAVRYKPAATLSFVNEMATIPTDKPVVIYCGTGHNSAFVTAYLRLFGFDARTLKYGNNAFMYNKMVEERSTLSWLPFTTADVNDYDLVK